MPEQTDIDSQSENKAKPAKDSQIQSDRELEIENGFFSIDESSEKAGDKIDSQTLIEQENNSLSDEEFSGKNFGSNLSNDKNEDTIDAAFNSALGITNKDNITSRNSQGIYKEESNENEEMEDDEKDII